MSYIIMEIIGYIASVIVFISFIVNDVKLLRTLNNIGCFLFLIYAIYNLKIPLIILNSAIIVINYIKVRKIKM